MTANQINYQKLLEDIRTHVVNENIGYRQAAAAERQATVAEENAVTNRMNAETNRKNSIINESAVGAQWYGAQANAAYQQTMAAVSQATQSEAARHNRTTESQDMIKQGQNVTYNYYKLQKDVELEEKKITQNYLLKGGETLLNAALKIGGALIAGG